MTCNAKKQVKDFIKLAEKLERMIKKYEKRNRKKV